MNSAPYLTLSVCIPCIQEHIYLLDRCVESIYTQSLLPDEVVISISSVDNMNTQPAVENLIGRFRDKLNIIVYYTSAQHFAGENRNKAVIHSTGDIISFIDADDIMYSNRLNIILTLFRVYPLCIGILHLFTENVLHDTEPDQVFNINSISEYMFSEYIHFGHPSFRRALFDKYIYNNSPRVQDFEFIESILPEHQDNLIVYNQKLTCYVSDDSTFYGR